MNQKQLTVLVNSAYREGYLAASPVGSTPASEGDPSYLDMRARRLQVLHDDIDGADEEEDEGNDDAGHEADESDDEDEADDRDDLSNKEMDEAEIRTGQRERD